MLISVTTSYKYGQFYLYIKAKMEDIKEEMDGLTKGSTPNCDLNQIIIVSKIELNKLLERIEQIEVDNKNLLNENFEFEKRIKSLEKKK